MTDMAAHRLDDLTAEAPPRAVEEPWDNDWDETDFSFDEPSKPSLLRRIVVKVRLLPMMIFFATLTLTVRVGDIWDGVEGFLDGTLSVSSAEAQAQDQNAAGGDLALPGGEGAPADMMGGGEGDAPGSGELDMPMMPEEDRAAVAARMLADDPTLLTQSEIDLLQKLAERRVEIDARARELEKREAMLAAAESRIDRKIEEFRALQQTIDSLVNSYQDQQDEKLRSLVKIYETMKPKDAARIFEELDMSVLLKVAERMKERSLAPVLAEMNSQRARELTVELDRLRKLPDDLANMGLPQGDGQGG